MAVFELADSVTSTSGVDLTKPQKYGVEAIREEMDAYLEQMCEFHQMMPDEVFRLLSAWTARATELRIQLNRTDNQRSNSLRTREIDPFLEECERQFKFHSRIQATHEMDLRMVRGQT